MSGDSLLRDGVRLSVRSVGEGRPMLWQHGLCGDAGQTAEVFPAGLGWRGVTVECRGHGGSDLGPGEALSLAGFAEDLAAWAEAVAPLPVGGISMGAALALRLAATRPTLVRALVLARPAWVAGAAPANMAPYRLAAELLGRMPPGMARLAFEGSAMGRRLAAEAPDNLASLRAILSRAPTEGTRALLARIGADGPGVTRDEIARIAVPTLVIGHGRDLCHPLSMAEDLAGLIPGARLAVIAPKAEGRDAYLGGFREALAAFLKELP